MNGTEGSHDDDLGPGVRRHDDPLRDDPGRGDEFELDPDPLREFSVWLAAAVGSGAQEPYAMTLATSTSSGDPSARMVLLRGFDERGLTFYTNYESRKGRELAENPRAALVFYWDALHRQVRFGGPVARVDRDESAAYFSSRPRGSRLAAWASAQSRTIGSRHELERRFREMDHQFPADNVPLPPFWGGFRLFPESVEFWRGRPNRLHDRALYERQPDGQWVRGRLAP